MGINPGKIGLPSPPRLASAGGWVGAAPARHNARSGRAGLAGRGNDAGAAKRLQETEDIGEDVFAAVTLAAQLTPVVQTIDEPTYSEQLNAIRTPVGGIEFLWSGTDPVDPGDCDLWPDSPLCGGSVLDPGGIGLYGPQPAGFSINVSLSPTEILVQLDPTIFGVNLPPVWLGFRRPGAQEAVDAYWGPGETTITPAGGENFGWEGCDIIWLYTSDSYPGTINIGIEIAADLPLYANKVFFNIPPIPIDTGDGGQVYRFSYMARSIAGGLATYRRDLAEGYAPSLPPPAAGIGGPFGGYGIFQGRIQRSLFIEKTPPPIRPPETGYQLNPDLAPYGFYNGSITFTRPDGIARSGFAGANQSAFYPRFVAMPLSVPSPPPPPPNLPPRSPALQPEEPMACDCKKLEELLKKILALLDHEGTRELDLTPCETDPDAPSGDRKYTWQGKGLKGVFDALEKLTDGTTETYQSSKCIAPALGVKKLPWNLPGNMGNGQGSETIDNYAELQIYTLKQLSQMLGQTEIKVKVKDSNLAQGGNQEIELKFANLSEAIAELAGLALTNQALSSASLNAAMTATVQAGMAFSTSAVVDRNLGEILEYLGFAVQRRTFEAPLAYTPGKNSPEEFLKDSTAKLSYWRNDDRNTLQNHISTLEQAAAIIRAAFFERIAEGSDGAEDIKAKIREAVGGVGSDFDTFLDRVESGYLDEAGTQEITPYGRPFNERPRIRKISAGGIEDGTNA